MSVTELSLSFATMQIRPRRFLIVKSPLAPSIETPLAPPALAEKPPAVIISMHGDHVVVDPPHELDLDATVVLMDAVASAIRSGATVMIDLDASTPSADLIARSPSVPPRGLEKSIDRGTVRVLGAGRVRLATADSYWTVDVALGRLCRSEKPIDTCFLGASDWVRIRALWVNCTEVTALTSDGTYLSARPVWAHT